MVSFVPTGSSKWCLLAERRSAAGVGFGSRVTLLAYGSVRGWLTAVFFPLISTFYIGRFRFDVLGLKNVDIWRLYGGSYCLRS